MAQRRILWLNRNPPTVRSLAIGLLAFGWASCEPDPAAAPNSPEASSSLLDRLAEAQISGPFQAELDGWLRDSASDRLLLREDFDALDPQWFSGTWVQASSQDPAAPREGRCQQRPELAGAEGVIAVPPGTAGLHRVLATSGKDVYAVRVRWRALQPQSTTRPSFVVRPLAGPLPADLTAVAVTSLDAPQYAGPRTVGQKLFHGSTIELQETASERWHEVQVVVPRHPEIRGLRLSLSEGEGGLLVDFVEVRRLTVVEQLGQGHDCEVLDHPYRRGIAGKGTTWDCLVLPGESSLSWPVTIPTKNARLDLWPALWGGGAEESLQVFVDLNGTPIATKALQLAKGYRKGAADAWRIDLSDHAGASVELKLRAQGSGDCVALLGAPRLLGAEAPGRPNLILLSIDTLRADVLGCYGAEEVRTPALDRLASEGTRFQHVLTPTSYTLPAHATMLSGQHPLEHGTRLPSQRLDAGRSPLLATYLRPQGYLPVAFTGGGLVHPTFGFARGFDRYGIRDPGGVGKRFQEEPPELAAESGCFAALLPALKWLEDHADQRFFLFVHTYFVHNFTVSAGYQPSTPPADWEAVVRRAEQGDRSAADLLSRWYQASVEEVDAHLVRPLLAALERLQLLDRTILAVLSDHGEAFGEHEFLFHGTMLFAEVIQVPWMLRGPGIPTGGLVAEPCSLLDVMPTLLARLDIAADQNWTGRDLLAVPAATLDRSLVLDLRNFGVDSMVEWQGLVHAGHKFVRVPGGDRQHLFRYPDDPTDAEDLGASSPGVLQEMSRELEQRLDRYRRGRDASEQQAAEVSAELQQHLRELGYVEAESD